MNSLIIKSLIFTAILMIGTLAVVWQMRIDLSDPVNMIAMIGALAIAGLSFGVSAKYISQMKTDTVSGELAEENWDGIGEYKNELPSGWVWSFIGAMIWGMWYFFASPYTLSGYSQIGEYNEEVKTYNAKFEAMHKNADAATLQEMGESIFSVQCAPCHGITGDGLSGKAEDLTLGYSKSRVLDIIAKGQNTMGAFPGGMPPGMASGAGAEKAAEFVATGFKGTAPAEYGVCAGCHGMTGEGMASVGPRINGRDITNTLAAGKTGNIGAMPAFKNRFTPVQEKAIEAYVSSLKQ
ncbi:MAG TPA: cytochrome C oxidase subunit III [Sulfurovum sp.]|nr:cytochrome C oxidase subunit III [Sulfurovum sp.]